MRGQFVFNVLESCYAFSTTYSMNIFFRAI
uniref:Uncharacterized protein n=1 Tax=Arundo donax TaxID=35708 RepID=A0A0A8Y0Z7_ARUDO